MVVGLEISYLRSHVWRKNVKTVQNILNRFLCICTFISIWKWVNILHQNYFNYAESWGQHILAFRLNDREHIVHMSLIGNFDITCNFIHARCNDFIHILWVMHIQVLPVLTNVRSCVGGHDLHKCLVFLFLENTVFI